MFQKLELSIGESLANAPTPIKDLLFTGFAATTKQNPAATKSTIYLFIFLYKRYKLIPVDVIAGSGCSSKLPVVWAKSSISSGSGLGLS